MEVDDAEKQQFDLEPQQELRFDVTGREDVELKLLEGMAEIFGAPLEQHKKYLFSTGSRAAVFTWGKAKLELIGSATCYVSDDTPMIVYVNAHAALEQLRKAAEKPEDKERAGQGPRMMVVGPTDVGKSTFCRILCNYAVRQGHTPIYVDLDVGQNSISVPGSIAAVHVNRVSDVVDGGLPASPLVYNFGALSPSDNNAYYNKLVEALAKAVSVKTAANLTTGISGVIINTCGWIADEGYAMIVEAALQFEVDIVVVLDQERLYNELVKTLPSFVKIAHLPKSGGVETRSRERRIRTRNFNIHRYFYGTRTNTLAPHSYQIKVDTIKLVKIGTEAVPDECLPVGMKKEDYSSKVLAMQFNPNELRYQLLAISPCKEICPEVATTPVLGYIVITEVDAEEGQITVLSPQDSIPEGSIFVHTKIQFLDDFTMPM
ncbi:unnamed protein product, partial [Mesorhabditis spiculigera]